MRSISLIGTIISCIAENVSRKPKSALFIFALTVFCVSMYQQGKVVIAEQGDMKLMKLKDDTVNYPRTEDSWGFLRSSSKKNGAYHHDMLHSLTK